MKVMIIVTHLLGTGHLRRAMTLARAFLAAGHQAHVVSGGAPVAGIRHDGVTLTQLPPLKSDGVTFTTLLCADGTVADEADLQARQRVLVDTFRRWRPDVLITELYPFGRRVLSEEFLAVLDAAQAMRPAPLILSSIRDILAPPSKPSKAIRTDEIVTSYYDAVLVHSDEAATPLSVSWPVTDEMQARLCYTGFVASQPPDPHPDRAGHGDILVSAGGGAVGGALFCTAREAAVLVPELTWRILVGGTDPQATISALADGAPPNLIVEPARPDFRQMLHHAACSVSMAGYNTAMDLLQTGCPALLVPFDDGGEVEQTLRAQSLSHLPGLEVIRSNDLSGPALAQAVKRLARAARRDPTQFALTGAHETVRIVHDMQRGR